MAVEGKGGGNGKEKGKKKPKDSEFYEIPPDLKAEFDMLMTGKQKGDGKPPEPKFEQATRSRIAREKYAKMSMLFALTGPALPFIGPILAIVYGLMARKAAKGSQGGEQKGPDFSLAGIILGAAVLAGDAVVLLLLLK